MGSMANRLRVVAFLALWLAACSPAGGPAHRAADDPLQVAVTVPPQAYLVERIGGERVTTEVLMASGASEETFSPSPRQLVALSRADVYVLVGHPAFLVEERHVLPALVRSPDVRVVAMWAGAGGDDPHVWTAPRHMRSAAVRVADALSDLDPPGAPTYRARLESFLAELDALDAEIRRELSGLARRRFLVTHPAWGHLAAQYGLEQVAIEEEGKEPGPRALVALVERARAEGVSTVFSQQGFPDAAARAVAAELGARVVPLDPLARSWLDNTRATARAITASLEAP